MEEKIYSYEVHDNQKDVWAPWHTPAALDYIEKTPQRRVIKGTERTIDVLLLDDERRALFGPNSQEAKLLVQFDRNGGIAKEPIDINIAVHPLARLIGMRLVDTEQKGDFLELKLSALGYLAIKQLL